ncbi:MAG TPA: family 16 glycosylhydrolase, partial [Stellaceae bacterium]|nr:family 16 glycosylhydrolase [Stellaceae bacterium]
MTYYNYLGVAMPESANPTASLSGNDPAGGDVWTAPPGPSSVAGDGGGDTLIGNTGDITFYITNPHDVVQASPNSGGTDTIVAYTSYALPDNVQNLDVYGDFNYAVGNDLNNLIIVNGEQWVDGGAGNDVLVGGSGNATFEEGADQGSDVIYGWHAGDQIQLTGTSFTDFAQIQSAMTEVNGDVVIQVDPSDTLTIRNTAISDFSSAAFLQPLNTSLLGPLTFDDEFNSLNLYNPSTNTGMWETNFGGNLKDQWAYTLVSNGELEEYVTPSFRGRGDQPIGYNPFSITNGVLTIAAEQIPAAQQSDAYDGTYFSGMINTLGTFQQQYGYFEMRAAFSAVPGTWPGFWMMAHPFVPNSEADITEHLGATPNVDYVRAYGGDGSTQTLYNNIYMADPTGFHTYGLLWSPTTVTYYLDGNAVMEGPTPSTWTQPMALIVNLAVGGWAGTPDTSAFPAGMQIDYVRAYALADGSSIVQHPTPTLPAATIVADGAQIASDQSAAQVVAANFDTGGAPVTSNAISFSQSAPDPNNLPSGDTFFVWEHSGAVFGANAEGGQLAAQTAFIAGAISQFNGGTWLTDGSVALTYYQTDSGVQDLWTLVFNPATGTLNRQELGPATDDVHIVATAKDGFAVSWNSAGTIESIAYDAHAYDGTGWLGQTLAISGDLLGINGAGDLVAAVAGTPGSVQLYSVVTPATTVPASISLSPNMISEADGASGLTSFTYTVTRSYDLSGTSSVNWSVIGNSEFPAAAADFQNDVLPSGTVTFAPGDSTATIAVNVVGGLNLAHNETFAVDLTNIAGAVLGTAEAEGTILPASAGSSNPPPPSVVDTSASTYTVPAGVQDVQLTGSAAQTVTGNALGDTITSNDYGSTLIGGTGNDTLIAGHGADTLTGGGGTDSFVFNSLPWNAGQITDFTPGTDKIDISALLSAAGYTGSDPVTDGYVTFVSDGAGDAKIYLNTHDPSDPWPALITTLDHVAPSGLTAANVFGEASSSNPPPPPPPTVVDTSAPSYTVPAGVQGVQLTGSAAQTVTANALGDTITSNDYGSTLIGGTGNDTLIAGHGADTLTGGGGADSFVFNSLPWNAGQITDFTPGTDKIDISALLSAAGYTGSDPVTDGYVTFVS